MANQYVLDPQKSPARQLHEAQRESVPKPRYSTRQKVGLVAVVTAATVTAGVVLSLISMIGLFAMVLVTKYQYETNLPPTTYERSEPPAVSSVTVPISVDPRSLPPAIKLP